MTQPQSHGLRSQGLAAQGPLPAGMLRIQQGHQERYVWPVHLPGWLALGWRVAGPSDTAAEPLPQVMTASAADLASPPEPTATRGKRGRRRKEEEPQSPAGVEAHSAPTNTDAEQQADSDPAAVTDLAAETAADPGDDSIAEGAVALSALPDDLFSDPLI
jgi:hypothetical protein